MLSVISSIGHIKPARNAEEYVRMDWVSTGMDVSGVGWTRFRQGNGWYVLCKFSAPTLAVSSNLTNWTTFSIGNGINIGYGNNVFMAIVSNASTNTIRRFDTTVTPVAWTSHSIGILAAWKAVAYGNGVWIAVSITSGRISRSYDNGSTWTATTITFTPALSGIADLFFSDGKFYLSANAFFVSSDNGDTWTSIASAKTGFMTSAPSDRCVTATQTAAVLDPPTPSATHITSLFKTDPPTVSSQAIYQDLGQYVWGIDYGNEKYVVVGGNGSHTVIGTASTFVFQIQGVDVQALQTDILSSSYPIQNVLFDTTSNKFISFIQKDASNSTLHELV